TSKGEDAKRDIEASTQRPDTCEVWPLDLSSHESVKAFAARATRELARIDIVLESAGVATGSFALVEGNESTLTTNVVSTYLLALLLLPKLKSVGQKYNVRPTVTIVTSDTHVQPAFEERKAPQGKIFEALNTEKGANMGERYPLSKLLEILAGREIVRRHPQPYPVVLNLVNPGFCHSSLMREMHLVGLVMKYIFGARSTEQGSRTYVQAVAMGPESHGKYMSNARIEDPSAFVRSEDGAETGRRVWEELSAKLEAIEPGNLGCREMARIMERTRSRHKNVESMCTVIEEAFSRWVAGIPRETALLAIEVGIFISHSMTRSLIRIGRVVPNWRQLTCPSRSSLRLTMDGQAPVVFVVDRIGRTKFSNEILDRCLIEVDPKRVGVTAQELDTAMFVYLGQLDLIRKTTSSTKGNIKGTRKAPSNRSRMPLLGSSRTTDEARGFEDEYDISIAGYSSDSAFKRFRLSYSDTPNAVIRSQQLLLKLRCFTHSRGERFKLQWRQQSLFEEQLFAMAAPVRPSLLNKKIGVRPPTMRPPPSRAQSATPAFNGRASPADSMVSASTSASRVLRSPQNSVHGGTKRKERDFEQDTGEETNINVVVRCRGRSEREVRENSGVVVSTDGIKGKNVELSMGPSALSNKTYHFDKVFSPAADQNIIFDEVVTPILDEVLGGFNCTLFAYGQTGTGKTYTMSGDITDMQPLPPEAGIIPRVLFSLFTKLESEESEHSVKCSFIELYNEELRDLLSVDDTAKLKIFEDTGKKGGNTTMVQGMEESHIKTASKGIQLLREGSHKRQVAATKCNDLSSRSHTVFTITVYMKRTADTGEEFISAGKLNLVDLAGSENIQRSGAENKRAAEAGLINKSLLTLGRVINALVDKSSHIPYRESKLTRLLQDSLGGRTKTCIIATLSPAKSNLEETISTLDYAFRAKNIRNKPQVNSTVSKKTLLKEFTAEIEKLKTELIATRHRNGVYLTTETYEEMTTESESRRILSEEQRDKIETMETNLRNKVQELFSLTTNFNHLKKENEATRLTLQGTEDILTKTESVLRLTQQNLTEETAYRKAHQVTEEQLTNMGSDMISTLGRTTSDINGLRSKIRRRSDLQSLNRRNWTSSQRQVSNVTGSVEDRIEELQAQQRRMIISLSTRMQDFVHDELQKLSTSQTFLQDKIQAFEASRDEVNQQTSKARDDMNEVLEEIKTLREGVKEKVGAGLDSLSAAAQRISAGIVTELEAFHTQVGHETTSNSLGKDFKSTFDDLIRRLNEQHSEANELRSQIVKADATLLEANKTTQSRLVSALTEQKQKAACERAQLLQDVTNLVNASAEASDRRLDDYVTSIANEIKDSGRIHEQERAKYETGMEGWKQKSKGIIEDVLTSRETVKSKIKGDWTAANEHTNSIRNTTTSVHDETIRIVDAQMAHMETQLSSLDELVSRVRAQNETHHAAHTTSLAGLSSSVQDSYSSISSHLETSYDRVKDLNSDMSSRTQDLQNTLPSLDSGAQIR
ncbi:MAG: hypothetical protein Q9157_008815, partial [Trypethelium eluteriae]